MRQSTAETPVSNQATLTRSNTEYPEIMIIVGTGRSGTSYLASMLRRSLDIGYAAEPKFVVPMYHRLRRFGNLEDPANLCKLVKTIHAGKVFTHFHQKDGIPSRPEEIMERISEPTYTGLVYAVFQLLADKRGHSRLGYKDPTDVAHISLLAKLLPTARFIHIIRDGRDVARSLLKFQWGANNLYSGARYWSRQVSIGQKEGRALSDGRYFELRYEDLVLDTEKEATRLGEFINRGSNMEQVQDLIDRINLTKKTDGVYGWKQSLKTGQRYLCEAAAGEVLRGCGYSTEFDGRVRIAPTTAAYYIFRDLVLRARNRLGREIKKKTSRFYAKGSRDMSKSPLR